MKLNEKNSLTPPAGKSPLPLALDTPQATYEALLKENEHLRQENQRQATIISGHQETLKMLHDRFKDAITQKDEEISQLFSHIHELMKERNISKTKRRLYADIFASGKIPTIQKPASTYRGSTR